MATTNENKENFELPSYDDIFSSKEEREGSNVTVDIPLDLIDDFPNHPFKVRDDEEMKALIESITVLGQLSPAIVRPVENGRYQLVSGHRRKYANERIGNTSMPCQIRNMSLEEATVLMVESNIYRTNVTTSEKSFAFKMRFDAIKVMKEKYLAHDAWAEHAPDYIKGSRGKTKDTAAAGMGISRSQGARYIRFTYLTPELLELLDVGKLTQSSAVNISYLDEECMNAVVDVYHDSNKLPDEDASDTLRAMAQDNKLKPEQVSNIVLEKKEEMSKTVKFMLKGTVIMKTINEALHPGETVENFVTEAVDLLILKRNCESNQEFAEKLDRVAQHAQANNTNRS